jgi:hypothetical protein
LQRNEKLPLIQKATTILPTDMKLVEIRRMQTPIIAKVAEIQTFTLP